jgi:hypothetical protein
MASIGTAAGILDRRGAARAALPGCCRGLFRFF